MRIYHIILVLVATTSFLFGQQEERCSMTIQAHEQMLEENEAYRLRVEEWRKSVDKILKERGNQRNPNCANGPIKIPVAIHFDSGLVPSAQEACVIDVVVDQIAEMNNEIAGLDVDAPLINNFLSCFGAGILGDASIEFCIGQFNHPSGFGLVDGDYAVTFGQVSFSVPSGNFTPVNPLWSDYINIYVDNLPGGLLGVSNGIPGGFNGDGVLIDNCVFGTGNISCPGVQLTGSSGCFFTYDEGETLAHELGHYLGLIHIWGDNSSCGGPQDQIADTPNMSTNYNGYLSCGSHTSCANLPVTCSSEDMYMNFMSYAGDACMYMFTSDQSDVMNATAIVEGFTISSSKCLAPPVADFLPVSPIDLCNTECINFLDQSSNSPDSWDWIFQVISGNLVFDIISSTLQNPTLCLLAGDQGEFRVRLNVSNSSGSDVLSRDVILTVLPDITYYADTDGDGFGDINQTTIACEQPSGFVLNDEDCDDMNPNIYPGNTEACDGIDNNCNDIVDEGCMVEDCDGEFLIINLINQNTYRAEIEILSDAALDNGQNILFAAGNLIDLVEGFDVNLGTQFDAKIENCNPINMDSEGFEVDKVIYLDDLKDFEQQVLEVLGDDDFTIELRGKDQQLLFEGSITEDGLSDMMKKANPLIENGEYYIMAKSEKIAMISKVRIGG